jgi:hypothetical protein
MSTQSLIAEESTFPNNKNEEGRAEEPDRATGWIRQLSKNNPELEDVRDALIGSRAEMLDRVKELGLPIIPYAHSTVEDFLASPEKLTKGLSGERFFYTIQPSSYAEAVKSPSPGVATLSQITELAEFFTESYQGTKFTIVVSEAVDVAYLGNIVINESGDMYGEFTDENIPPTRSGISRVRQFQKDPWLGTFCYNFEDTELRRAIYNSIQSLPHRGTGRDAVWQKGYYELNLVRTSNGTLTPAFYDFRDSKAFLYVPANRVVAAA